MQEEVSDLPLFPRCEWVKEILLPIFRIIVGVEEIQKSDAILRITLGCALIPFLITSWRVKEVSI
jgi:hypothetical protein